VRFKAPFARTARHHTHPNELVASAAIDLQAEHNESCIGRGMNWHGKALGAVVGVFAGGPVGALAGAFIGHLFDAHASAGSGTSDASLAGSLDVQESFFSATFQLMGHIAKADGRVSEDDIRAARAMMTELRLAEREVQRAIELFTQGKAPDFQMDGVLRDLYARCRKRPDLCRMFIQIQLQAALWSGSLHPAARRVLSRACDALDLSAYELVQMEALLRMQRSARQPRAAQPAVDRLTEAYAVLGVGHTASNPEVTKAYRRLMNQNHPDKLLAKGLPESMMKMAEEKTRQIRSAYEVVRDARQMK
jgi:DnaJ like chaperone protein